MPLFVKRDKDRPSLVRNIVKSQRAEREWSRNRWTHMQGIKDYAGSIEANKDHRQLGRFLATHEFYPKNGFLGRDPA